MALHQSKMGLQNGLSDMPEALKIAIVEDHDDLRELLVDYLGTQMHDVAGFTCADDLDEHLAGREVDLLILDLNLPGEDGYSIAERLRKANPTLYIIILTARTAVTDRIKGYAAGADIYLTKPVTPDELGATVGGVARRVMAERSAKPGLLLNTVRLTLRGSQGEISIGKSETALLKGLAEAPGHRLEYWRLMELLGFGIDEKGQAELQVHISRLRKKIQQVGVTEPAIKSLWKDGYLLCTPLSIVH